MGGFWDSLTGNESVALMAKISQDKIKFGVVERVDTRNNTMRMYLMRDPNDNPQEIEFPIDHPVTSYGAGLRVMPISGLTIANVYEDTGGKFYHMGYQLEGIGDITDDRLGDRQDDSSKVLLRHLDEGDVCLSGTYGNEIYLPIDGSVSIKSSLGSHLKLDNYLSRLDGGFANLKFEMDGVRIRAGNIIRPSREDTTEDQYIVMGKDDVIKGVDELEEDEQYTQIREFTVQVGTLADPNNNYRDFASDKFYEDISPTVGIFSLADAYVRENGKPLFTAKTPVRGFLKSGDGGFMVANDGSFYIMDYNNWSSSKFPTNSERSLRLRQSFISIADQEDEDAEYKTEIQICHESNASIELREGYVQLQEGTGRYFKLDGYGATLNAPEAAVSIIAKDIQLLADGGSVAIGGFPTDGVVKATHASTLFDTHTHTGPVGPPLPSFQWTPLVQIPNSPLVAQGLKVV